VHGESWLLNYEAKKEVIVMTANKLFVPDFTIQAIQKVLNREKNSILF
jgi:hypothetical protein